MRRHTWLFGIVLGLWVTGCAVTRSTHTNEPLYLAMELKQYGQTVATPKLVGFEGHRITAERRFSEGVSPYRLQLTPEVADIGYQVQLEVEWPAGHSTGHYGLLHGEERTIALDADTELTMRLMRVDSDEFRALMQKHRVTRL